MWPEPSLKLEDGSRCKHLAPPAKQLSLVRVVWPKRGSSISPRAGLGWASGKSEWKTWMGEWQGNGAKFASDTLLTALPCHSFILHVFDCVFVHRRLHEAKQLAQSSPIDGELVAELQRTGLSMREIREDHDWRSSKECDHRFKLLLIGDAGVVGFQQPGRCTLTDVSCRASHVCSYAMQTIDTQKATSALSVSTLGWLHLNSGAKASSSKL